MTRRYIDYASDGRQAYPITDEIFTAIVRALLRDPGIRSVTTFDDLELLLADDHRDAERKLVCALRGRVRLEDLEEEEQ
jgi:hypothetical protein